MSASRRSDCCRHDTSCSCEIAEKKRLRSSVNFEKRTYPQWLRWRDTGVDVVAAMDPKRRKIVVHMPPSLCYEENDYHIKLIIKLNASKDGTKSMANLVEAHNINDRKFDGVIGMCSVCWDARCDCALSPCGHMVCCACGDRLYKKRLKCPLCRKAIEKKPQKIYL